MLIHSATWTKPEPSPEIAQVIGIGGFQLFRHGPVRLTVAASKHPMIRHSLNFRETLAITEASRV